MPVTDKEHLDALASNRKLDEKIRELEAALAAKEKAAAAPPPAPAPAPPPAPEPPPPPPPTSAIAFVKLPLAEQEKLKKAEPGIFDRLLRQTGRVTVTDREIYVPGEIIRGRDVPPPSSVHTAPTGARKPPAVPAGKR
ncbi:MAG TPA: hypothetical protein VGM13_06470 [Thermoanaerobaculia bacterium]|jgi:hypothetical protein